MNLSPLSQIGLTLLFAAVMFALMLIVMAWQASRERRRPTMPGWVDAVNADAQSRILEKEPPRCLARSSTGRRCVFADGHTGGHVNIFSVPFVCPNGSDYVGTMTPPKFRDPLAPLEHGRAAIPSPKIERALFNNCDYHMGASQCVGERGHRGAHMDEAGRTWGP